ncbi:MAG TPA: alpha/beta hydrolase [Nitrospiria bacterium]|nr:alpha/beta hydrolase [Nitrospiria bacterium]
MIEESFSIKDSQGGLIPGIFCRPDQNAVGGAVLCHGFLSSSESKTNLALTQFLLAKGFATVRFDFFGHGKSKEEFAQMTLSRCVDQLERVLAWFKTKRIRRVGIVGSSFGGLVALLVSENHPELRTVALKCPVSDYTSIWRGQLGEAGMQYWESSGLTSIVNGDGSRARLGYGFYQDLLQYDGYAAAGKIEVPVLIVHGDRDAYVPIPQSERLRDFLPGEKRLEKIPGADHEFSRVEDFEKMTGLIGDWLVEKLR